MVTMDVVAYLRVLRRHWKMIVAAAVVGVLIGAGSTIFSNSSAESGGHGNYYQATHTLYLDTSSDSSYSPVFRSIDQIAILTTTGDVPKIVADRIGGDGQQRPTHIYVTTNGTLPTIDSSASERSRDEAVRVADACADALVNNIQDKEETRLNQQRDQTLQRISDVQNQISA